MLPVEPKVDCTPDIVFGNPIRRRSTDHESCLFSERGLRIACSRTVVVP